MKIMGLSDDIGMIVTNEIAKRGMITYVLTDEDKEKIKAIGGATFNMRLKYGTEEQITAMVYKWLKDHNAVVQSEDYNDFLKAVKEDKVQYSEPAYFSILDSFYIASVEISSYVRAFCQAIL